MIIFMTAALLAGSKLQIDRGALDVQARAEALQPRQTARSAQPVRRPVPRRASGGNPLDLAQITTICRAAGEQADPGEFVGRLSSAYGLSADDNASLRASCGAYLAGRADARRSGRSGY
ncbi:MAG TPA: hypothetical protein VEW04_09405 [Allosphingosinicella sp.]|nr:hypothetical protein [Allosphingosinicella sp.]